MQKVRKKIDEETTDWFDEEKKNLENEQEKDISKKKYEEKKKKLTVKLKRIKPWHLLPKIGKF